MVDRLAQFFGYRLVDFIGVHNRRNNIFLAVYLTAETVGFLIKLLDVFVAAVFLKVLCVHINDQLIQDRCTGFLSSCGDFSLINEPLQILVVGQTAGVLEVNIAGNLLGVYIKICVAFILTADFVTPINSATCSCFRCFSCRSCFSLADRLYIIVFTSSPCILSDMGFQLGDWRVTVYRQK